MPLSSSSSVSKPAALLNRENSLPTYEEATISAPREYGFIVPSAPPLSTATHHDVHSYGRTNRHSPNRAPISEGPLREHDVERALTQTNLQYHTDPAVRQMAETVMAECRRAKDKREMKAVMNCFGFVIMLIVIIVVIAVKSTSGR